MKRRSSYQIRQARKARKQALQVAGIIVGTIFIALPAAVILGAAFGGALSGNFPIF